jgi:hypothetical protein
MNIHARATPSQISVRQKDAQPRQRHYTSQIPAPAAGPSHFRISAFSPDPPIPGCAIIQPPLQKYFQLFRRPMENSNF